MNWPYEADLEHSHILRAARDDWFLLIESATFFTDMEKTKVQMACYLMVNCVEMIFIYQLRAPPPSFAPGVLLEEVVLPALARAGDEEPVVIEPHLVAPHVVMAVTVRGRGGGLTLAPRQKGTVIL